MTAPVADRLQFEPETHTYTLDGVRVPSVTQVIAPIVDYSHVPQFQLDWAAQRGTAAHKACELYDRGDLDYDSLDDRLKPYLDAWLRFRDDVRPEFEAIEERVYSETHRFAGTVDRIAIINGYRAVLEIKTTSTLLPAAAVQLGGYQIAYNERHVKPIERALVRYCVHLKADGRYSVLRYADDAGDRAEFLALLTHYYWSQRYMPNGD